MNFSIDYAIRLQQVQIECCDALRIIKSRDTADTFFYLDPPYVGSDQGHYDGYTQEDFNTLLETLANIKGKFLLSSFRNKRLTDFTGRNGWETMEIKMACPMSNKYKVPRTKIEVLTANYPILSGENSLKKG
jgi:DNA adenine methylase